MADLSLNEVLILITALVSILAFRNYELMDKLVLNPYSISRRQEYWRFVTSGFVHADFGHLFVNMFTLYSFGNMMEQIYNQISPGNGALLYLLLYIGGIIVSDLPTFFKHRNQFSYNSLGASGGVSSVLFAAILFAPTQSLYIFAILPIPAIVYGFLFTGYSIYMSKRSMSNINHDAHLYGALYGVIITIIIYPKVLMIFTNQILHWGGGL
ncbi:rhomboid family intramembrane serine protease [Flectobacillus sp. BAB-3569]|uniref:rhomboid family intramembrane serine protease n=1 Tax=unclassified Flectobacillus TaxID=2621086 RepID=UPI000BA3CE00|nr:rhomboid family intramembrane serine protease [Flectobacillus sp. BAB-3569]PAC33692.1 rhomboid family intramembrane serine protease [Flectobacillus sp. BAB-3569]